jgi:hypothetical protein
MNDAVAAKPRKARAPRKAEAPATDTFREEVGPTELYDPLVRSELKKAAVWIGMATLVVALIWLAQPILLIIGGLVLAAMFDGGARLLGRVLPIPRGFRLTIVVLAVFGFIYWTFVFTGSELASQAASLQAIVEKQIETIGNQIAAAGFNISADDVKGFGTQILNSVGRVTAAVSSVVGTLTNMAMMLVLAIFIAAEPRMYERGVAWMLPLAEREHFYGTAEKIGRVLRRLMAGRLLGMAVEGFGTWILLSLGGVPMAALLGILTGLLAFLPEYRCHRIGRPHHTRRLFRRGRCRPLCHFRLFRGADGGWISDCPDGGQACGRSCAGAGIGSPDIVRCLIRRVGTRTCRSYHRDD